MLAFISGPAKVFPLPARKECFPAALQWNNTTTVSADVLQKLRSFHCHYKSRHAISMATWLQNNKAIYFPQPFSEFTNYSVPLHYEISIILTMCPSYKILSHTLCVSHITGGDPLLRKFTTPVLKPHQLCITTNSAYKKTNFKTLIFMASLHTS
jgi:hypothetical protein